MSKLLSTGGHFVRHVVPSVLRPIRVLWNEMIGFVFLVFGTLIAYSTYRKYAGTGEGAGSPVVLLMGGSFALLLLYFGWSSFRRAKRIGRA